MAGVDNRKPDDTSAQEDMKGKAKATINLPADVDRAGGLILTKGALTDHQQGPSSSTPHPANASSPASARICTICLETPDTFGLLLNCDHVFCLGMPFRYFILPF